LLTISNLETEKTLLSKEMERLVSADTKKKLFIDILERQITILERDNESLKRHNQSQIDVQVVRIEIEAIKTKTVQRGLTQLALPTTNVTRFTQQSSTSLSTSSQASHK
jgi:hypothetical protein